MLPLFPPTQVFRTSRSRPSSTGTAERLGVRWGSVETLGVPAEISPLKPRSGLAPRWRFPLAPPMSRRSPLRQAQSSTPSTFTAGPGTASPVRTRVSSVVRLIGLARPGLGDAGQRFGKGPARTCGHRAPEPTNPDEQKRRMAEAGDVAEAAPVGAVDPPGRGAARETGCRGHGRLRPQHHPAAIMVDLVKDLESGREADRMQGDAQERYRIEGCFFLYGDPSWPWGHTARRAQPYKTFNSGPSTQNFQEP